MTKKLKKGLSQSIMILLVAFLLVGFLPGNNVVYSQPEQPRMLIWASMEIGSAVYTQFSLAGEGILDTLGLRVRNVPVATELGRLTVVRTGSAHLASMGGGVIFAIAGEEEYADRAWGPQPLRLVWQGARQTPTSMIATRASGVETIYEIEGKRVPRFVGAPGLNALIEAGLGFAGITWDDVVPVDVGSFGEAVQRMIEGDIDVGFMDASAGLAVELAESPVGFRWLELPVEDEEGWERHIEANPFYYPIQPTHGVNVDPDEKVWLATSPYPAMFAYDFTDKDAIYWNTRAIHEAYPNFKDKQRPVMEWWGIEDFLSLDPIVPYHDGTVEYLKEIGYWTDELEERQNRLVKEQQELQELWEESLLEADEKGIPDREFKGFWIEKLEEFKNR